MVNCVYIYTNTDNLRFLENSWSHSDICVNSISARCILSLNTVDWKLYHSFITFIK